MQEENQKPKVEGTKRSPLKRLVRVLLFFVLFLFILVVFSSLIIQIPAVQNWTVNKITNNLSQKLDTKVSIDSVHLNIFEHLKMDGFYVEDQRGDTLIYNKQLKVKFKKNIINVILGQIDIEEIYLQDGMISLNRNAGEEYNNLVTLLNKLNNKSNVDNAQPVSKDTTIHKNGFLLNVEDVFLDNIVYKKTDEEQGNYENFHFKNGRINFHEIDLANNYIKINYITSEDPVIDIIKQVPAALWQDTATISSDLNIEVDSSQLFVIDVDKLRLKNATLNVDNYRKGNRPPRPNSVIDWEHLRIKEFEADLKDVRYKDLDFTGVINKIALKSKSGFEIKNLHAKQASVTSTGLELYGLELETGHSSIKDTLIFKYTDYYAYDEFEDRVLLQANFKNSQVAVRDIMYFVPASVSSAFFEKNKNELLYLDGLVTGKINNLRGRNITLRIPNQTKFKGNFKVRNITLPGEELLNLEVEELTTKAEYFDLYIPNFNPPDNFNKLGNLKFYGKFDGTLSGFIAYGKLKTDLGVADLDMGLHLVSTIANATYSGKMNLIDFDLGSWTGNDQFGKVSAFAEVKNGKGISFESADAKLNGNIKSFTFRNYTYKNLIGEGQLSKNLFDGKFSIKDENVDMVFDGTIDFQDSLPLFDFKAKINELDAMTLNLIEQDFVFAGEVDINLKGLDISEIQGETYLQNFKILKNGNELYEIDSLNAKLLTTKNNKNELNLSSNILDLKIDGEFNIEQIPNAFVDMLFRHYPHYAKALKLKQPVKKVGKVNLVYTLNVKDSKNYFALLKLKDLQVLDLKMDGEINNYEDVLTIYGESPKFNYKDFFFNKIGIEVVNENDHASIKLSVDSSDLSNRLALEPIQFYANVHKDSVEFEIVTSNFTKLFEQFHLEGYMVPFEKGYEFKLKPTDLQILNAQWLINKDNYLRIGDRYLDSKNFILTDGDREISVETYNEKGLRLVLENFSVAFLDEALKMKELDFEGNYNLNVRSDNIFNLDNLKANIRMDSFLVNGDNYGKLIATASGNNLQNPFDINLAIGKKDSKVNVLGYLDPKKNMEFKFDVLCDRFPLYIATYWIGDATSDIIGEVSSNVQFYGNNDEINIGGEALVDKAALTIDYLQTRYFIDSQKVYFDNYLFDTRGAEIRDIYGNKGNLYGGFRHNHLKKFVIDGRAKSDRILGLNTKKDDNEAYYGQGIGSLDATFKGPLKAVNIYINAVTGPGTKMFIPIDDSGGAGEISFVRFVNRDSLTIDTINDKSYLLEGIDVKMDLTLTPSAEAEIIFDAYTGDIMRGTGQGNLQINVSREGEFEMFGDYIIENGLYNYTFLNTAVNAALNKKFIIGQGSKISWTGDPYNAIVDINATYDVGNTPLSIFLQEFLIEGSVAASEARNSTEVDLTMFLTGLLLKPTVQFDIDFPDVTGELSTLVDSKLRTLKADQNQMNQQAFSLMLFNSFLPANSPFSTDQLSTGANTLISEWASSQLTNFLSGYFNEIISNSKFYSGIDFDIDVSQDIFGTAANTEYGDEYGFNVKNRLFNDRLTIDAGANIVSNSPVAGDYIAGDLIIEYAITPDRRLKLKAYRRTDQTIEGRKEKYGAGISWRKQFHKLFKKEKEKEEETNQQQPRTPAREGEVLEPGQK